MCSSPSARADAAARSVAIDAIARSLGFIVCLLCCCLREWWALPTPKTVIPAKEVVKESFCGSDGRVDAEEWCNDGTMVPHGAPERWARSADKPRWAGCSLASRPWFMWQG